LATLSGALFITGSAYACAATVLPDTQVPAAAPAAAQSQTAAADEVTDSTAAGDALLSGAGPMADSTSALPPADNVPRSPLKRLAHSIATRTSQIAHMLTQAAMRFIGVPYVFGGNSMAGIDCSAYVQRVYASAGIKLPRTADAQYYAARPLGGDEPVAGDLVFFQTYLPGPSHVGIYLGNGMFAQASSSHGVTVTALNSSYWKARFLGFRRVLPAS
jgi:cell wall-associated NlpC family hydrolase